MYNTEDILRYLSTQISVPQISPLSLNACGEPALVGSCLSCLTASPLWIFSVSGQQHSVPFHVNSDSSHTSSVYNKGFGVEQLRL